MSLAEITLSRTQQETKVLGPVDFHLNLLKIQLMDKWLDMPKSVYNTVKGWVETYAAQRPDFESVSIPTYDETKPRVDAENQDTTP